MLLKHCTQYARKFGKLSSGHRTGKFQFSFQSLQKTIPVNVQTTIVLGSNASKVMLKIFQARLQQYVNRALPDVKAELRRQRTQRSNCQHPLDHRKKQGNFRKTSTFASLTTQKLLCGLQQTGKCLKKWEYQTTLAAS